MRDGVDRGGGVEGGGGGDVGSGKGGDEGGGGGGRKVRGGKGDVGTGGEGEGTGDGSGGAAVGTERVVEREVLGGDGGLLGGRGGRGLGVDVLVASGKRPLRAGREVRLVMCEVKTAYVPSTMYQAIASDCADAS